MNSWPKRIEKDVTVPIEGWPENLGSVGNPEFPGVLLWGVTSTVI